MYQYSEIIKVIEEYGIPNDDEIPTTLYHYTSQSGFKGIIESRSIWATHIRYLNDSQEFEYACTSIKEILESYIDTYDRDTINHIKFSINGFNHVNICVCSFSKKRDDLSQWRAYSHYQTGYSIGFALDFLKATCAENEYIIAKCLYNRDAQREMLEKAIKQQVEICKNDFPALVERLKLILGILGPICKDPNFIDEDEIRIITPPRRCDCDNFDFREGKSSLIPYCKIKLNFKQISNDIREVLVGPTPEPTLAVSAANSFLYRNWEGIHDKDIAKKSTIPFRSWN